MHRKILRLKTTLEMMQITSTFFTQTIKTQLAVLWLVPAKDTSVGAGQHMGVVTVRCREAGIFGDLQSKALADLRAPARRLASSDSQAASSACLRCTCKPTPDFFYCICLARPAAEPDLSESNFSSI
jgi:hypothetical protein